MEKAHQALCRGPRLLYIILTLGGSPAIILAFGAGKRGSEDLSDLSSTNNPKQAQLTAKVAPKWPGLGDH